MAPLNPSSSCLFKGLYIFASSNIFHFFSYHSLIHGSYVAVICVFGHLSGQLASKVAAVIHPHKTVVYDHIFGEVEVRPKIQEPVILRDLALNQVGIEDAQASIWVYSQDTVNRKIPQLPSMTGFSAQGSGTQFFSLHWVPCAFRESTARL